MESPCLFTREQALKMGYFFWLYVKIGIAGNNHVLLSNVFGAIEREAFLRFIPK